MKSITEKGRTLNTCGKQLGLLALAVLLSGALPTKASTTVTVPFKATGTPVSVELGTDGLIHIMAHGYATQLGIYAASAVITLLPPEGPGEPPRFDGVITMTAANGDELNFHYSGVTTLMEGEGSYEITGGTGRFEGASGEGAFSSHNNMTTFDGTISLSFGE